MDIRTLADLRTPWCVHVVATLRIAEHMYNGVTAVDELASTARCDPHVLRRVLRHLVGNGVFEEPTPGRFELNDTARQLLDEGTRIFLDLDGLGGRFAHAWGTLLAVARTGRPAYADRFGLPYWEDLDANPELGAAFDALMGPVGHGEPDTDLLLDGDWSSIRTIVDVGGGTGSRLAAVLRARPELHGTLVDLPKTVTRATEVFHEAGVEDRVSTVAQSFFDPLPPGADLYLLNGVLNDWPERETVAILTRCAEAAAPSNGRVVVRGGVSPDEAGGDQLSVELVLLGGQNNSLAQFRALARAARLDVATAGTNAGGSYVVECQPVP